MPTQNQTQTQPKSQTQELPYVMVDFLDLDTSKFSTLPAKENQYGGHYIPLRYNGKALYVKYGRRVTPFGVSANKELKDDPRYRGNKKINGYGASISCDKDFESDPYFQKANELDEFFISLAEQNNKAWHLGLPRNAEHAVLAGNDDRGQDGRWKRLLKWSMTKKDANGDREYKDYPPRMEFGIPTISTNEEVAEDGLIDQTAVFKTVFYDLNGEKVDTPGSHNMVDIMPKFSNIMALAHWASLTQGTYGLSLKPKAQQFRVFPNEYFANDECYLGDDGAEEEEEDYAIPDVLGAITVRRANPAPLGDDEPEEVVEETEVVEDEVDEVVEDEVVEDVEEEAVEIIATPQPKRRRQVVTRKAGKQ